MASVQWSECPIDRGNPFRTKRDGVFWSWPILTDLMPWQHSGVQLKRTWPIAPDPATLTARWGALLASDDRAEAFRETGDRQIGRSYGVGFTTGSDPTPIANLAADAAMPSPIPYAYRSFDRQALIADARLISRPRPNLWGVHSDRQVYLTTLLTQPLSSGPALTAAAQPPRFFTTFVARTGPRPSFRCSGTREPRNQT